MNEDTAKEVEAALIDAYPGLTNIQGGSDSSRGVMHADEVVRIYEAAEAKFQHNVILINVNRFSDDQELYDAVRYAWKLSPAKARKFDYDLAVRRGPDYRCLQTYGMAPRDKETFPVFRRT
jgi:hypothetical protein